MKTLAGLFFIIVCAGVGLGGAWVFRSYQEAKRQAAIEAYNSPEAAEGRALAYDRERWEIESKNNQIRMDATLDSHRVMLGKKTEREIIDREVRIRTEVERELEKRRE